MLDWEAIIYWDVFLRRCGLTKTLHINITRQLGNIIQKQQL